jgi:hypothetical protein
MFDSFRLLANYPVERWVIWAGAGISIPPPARLPAGAPLTWFAVEQTCGAGVVERLRALWDEANRLTSVRPGDAPLGPIPRLETILGEVAAAEAAARTTGFTFMRGFRSFARAPANENHAVLAALMHAGATIVTTNFDSCVEDAYVAIAGAGSLAAEKIGNTWRFVRRDSRPGGLWHVHGAANDVPSLGATVAMVKEGLPPEFESVLRRRLREGVAVAFVGYSASDSFDVTPFFEALGPAEARASAAAFVQYFRDEVPPTAARLLIPFGRRAATERVDTTEWLRAAAAHAGVTPPAHGGGAFDWRTEFLRDVDLDAAAELRSFITCRVANVLGIDVARLDGAALADAARREASFEPDAFHKTLAIVHRTRGEAADERRHDASVLRSDEDMLGYEYANGNVARARELAVPVRELLALVNRDVPTLGWREYTSMSAHARFELNRRLPPMASAPTPAERRDVEDLIEIAHGLGTRPLRGVLFVNQVATARRFAFLFEALLNGREDTEAVEGVLRLYGDAASIAGFIGTYRDLAIARFLLVRFHRRWSAWLPAFAAARRSLALSRAAGDRHAVRRARQLLLRLAAAPV